MEKSENGDYFIAESIFEFIEAVNTVKERIEYVEHTGEGNINFLKKYFEELITKPIYSREDARFITDQDLILF